MGLIDQFGVVEIKKGSNRWQSHVTEGGLKRSAIAEEIRSLKSRSREPATHFQRFGGAPGLIRSPVGPRRMTEPAAKFSGEMGIVAKTAIVGDRLWLGTALGAERKITASPCQRFDDGRLFASFTGARSDMSTSIARTILAWCIAWSKRYSIVPGGRWLVGGLLAARRPRAKIHRPTAR
jgi:hypothetical protein